MKVVVYDDFNVVTQIFCDVYDPKIDRDRGVITHHNGKIFGLFEDDEKNFLLVEDHVPVEIGQFVTDSFKDYDQSHKYDGFSFSDIKRAVKEGVEEVLEVLKGKDEKDD